MAQETKGGGADKPGPSVTAVVKVDMHCLGCTERIRGSVRRFPGVEGVAMDEEKGTMTVVGRFDARKLRDRVAEKTKKKVDLVPDDGKKKKGGGNDDDGKKKDGGCGGDGGNQKGPDEGERKAGKNEEQKYDKSECSGHGGGGGGGGGNAGKKKDKGDQGQENKKPALPVVATVVLKVGAGGLHCDGCMGRIRHKLFKIKGVEQVAMELSKNQVTVTGTMDVKALPGKLSKKLRRPVDVAPPPPSKKQDGKDKDKDKEGGGKDKCKCKCTCSCCKDAAALISPAPETTRLAWTCDLFEEQAVLTRSEFVLSDENPNACSVM